LTKEHIPFGKIIACSKEFSADITMICGVSNLGGYALAIAIKKLSGENNNTLKFPTKESEEIIAKTLFELGVKDGCTPEKTEPSVDGILMEEYY